MYHVMQSTYKRRTSLPSKPSHPISHGTCYQSTLHYSKLTGMFLHNWMPLVEMKKQLMTNAIGKGRNNKSSCWTWMAHFVQYVFESDPHGAAKREMSQEWTDEPLQIWWKPNVSKLGISIPCAKELSNVGTKCNWKPIQNWTQPLTPATHRKLMENWARLQSTTERTLWHHTILSWSRDSDSTEGCIVTVGRLWASSDPQTIFSHDICHLRLLKE